MIRKPLTMLVLMIEVLCDGVLGGVGLCPANARVRDGEKTSANLRIESMKKPNKAAKPSKAKAPTQKVRGQVNPILDMFEKYG